MSQEKICYIIFFTLSSVLLENVFAASTNHGDGTLFCAPTGNDSISTTCCADLTTQGSKSYHMCATLSNKNGNIQVTGNLQSAGVVLDSVIGSTGSTCGTINSDPAEEACIDVLSRNATEICVRLCVQDRSGTSQSSPACLSLPSLKTTQDTGISRRDLYSVLANLFDSFGDLLKYNNPLFSALLDGLFNGEVE